MIPIRIRRVWKALRNQFNLTWYGIQDHILEYIHDHNLKPHDPLPSERSLCKELGLNRNTFRVAVKGLIDEGVLYNEPNRGNFVAPKRIRNNMWQFHSASSFIKSKGHAFSRRQVSLDFIEANKHLMTKLGIPIGTRVMALKRLAYADHSPLMIEESYIAADRFPGLWEFDFEIGSLYETIEVHYGVKLASQRVEIILGKAEKYEAELLEITPGDPIIIEQGYSYSQDGELVEYSVNNSTTRIEYAGYASVEEDLSRG